MSGPRYPFPPPSTLSGTSFHPAAFFYPAADAQGLPARPLSALGSGCTTDTVSADSTLPVLDGQTPRSLDLSRPRALGQLSGRLGSLSLDSDSTCEVRSGELSFRESSGGGTPKPPRKGQGYRKLWEQVTRVKEGQKLGKGSAEDLADMTVEDLFKVVCKLSPKESAADAVWKGLYYLDSSAMAALLKDLCKKGLPSRAMEIFDRLRKLDEEHQLRGLCDVYTYTTMVAQCGSHQQLRTALELVAEMKSRGIKCNVRTYTALMNVCIKVNEMDLALDVYRQMLQENITPNLVTFNTLIDIYGKKAEVDKAIEVLDTLESQGIHAEVRTYNTVITACSRSGNPEQAMSVYNRMLRKDVQPTATTYTTLISAYGNWGQVDKALEIFKDMIQRGCERNVITYSSLIRACEKANRWELAVELLNKMNRENCRPNAITYNSLISTCANCGRWSEACDTFNRMIDHGLRAERSTYAAVLAGLSQGGPWTSALNLYEDMLQQNFRPDVVTINAVLETLWQSGVEIAQNKAATLWKSALDKGIIWLNSPNGCSMEYLVVVWTCGAAIISVLHWLLEVRNRIGSGSSPVLQSQTVSLVLQRGRQCTVAQSTVAIHAAIASVLGRSGSPFSILLAEENIQLCAPTDHVASWLRTPDFWSCVGPVAAPVLTASSKQLIAEDKALEDRCCKIFKVASQLENKHVNVAVCLSDSLLDLRRHYIKWALNYGAQLCFKDETVHDALVLFDRVLATGLHQDEDNLQLVICVCIVMVGNLCEDPSVTRCPDLLMSFPQKSVVELQSRIRSVLGEEVGVISSLRVIQLYQERLGNCTEESLAQVRPLMQQVLISPQLLNFSPSVVAAAVLYMVRKRQGLVPSWPNVLAHMTGFTVPQRGAFADCIQLVGSICELQQASIPVLPLKY